MWTRLGLHGMDTSDPQAPKVVHGFMTRDADHFHIEETWDTLGMRATRSDDTVLEGAFIPDERIARVLDPGFAGADAFILCVFAWAEPTFANIYIGVAERALQLTVESVQHKHSVAGMTRSMAYHPEVQHAVADRKSTRLNSSHT